MNFDRLKNLIFEIVLNEIGETNVQRFGSEALMGRITKELTDVISKYGGDYDKAFASPEWQQITTNAEKTIGREKTNSLLGIDPVEPPPENLFKNGNTPDPLKKQSIAPPPKDLFGKSSQTDQTGSATTGTSASSSTKVFKKPVDSSSLASQALANKNKTRDRLQALRTQKPTAKLQEEKMTGITKTITEMVRKILAEEIAIFEEELNREAPNNGDTRVGPSGETYFWDDNSNLWLSSDEWDDVLQGKYEEDTFLNSPLGDDDSLTGEDPQMNDSADDRAEMIDSLMMMEFDSSPKKKISTKLLETLIRKNVRSSLRGEE